jgi:hypothetical protein
MRLVIRRIMTEYKVTRKIHEQSGSLLVCLPRMWARAQGLKDGSVVDLIFDDIVKILPPTIKEKS